MERRHLHLAGQFLKESSANDIDNARDRVFSYFVDQLLGQVEAEGHELTLNFTIQVLERLAKIKLPMHCRAQIRVRLFGKKQTLGKFGVNELAMRQIFQILYEELCDMIGPVKTDKYCKLALALVRKLPEAVLYPPQRLM